MKLLQILLLCASYATCLGGEPAGTDTAEDTRARLIARVFNRMRRDVKFPAKSSVQDGAETGAQSAFIRTEDVKDVRSPHGSLEPHIRVKRYRQNANHHPHSQAMRVGCRFGTCTVNNLVHQIFQYTDKDKDGTAPSGKIGSQGYGRRRRRSLPAHAPQLWARLLQEPRRAPQTLPAGRLTGSSRPQRLLLRR